MGNLRILTLVVEAMLSSLRQTQKRLCRHTPAPYLQGGDSGVGVHVYSLGPPHTYRDQLSSPFQGLIEQLSPIRPNSPLMPNRPSPSGWLRQRFRSCPAYPKMYASLSDAQGECLRMGADCVGVVKTAIKYIGFQICNGEKTKRTVVKSREGVYTRPYES